MSTDAFISYRRGDQDSWLATALHLVLKAECEVFFDADRGSIDLGDNFARRIDEGLATCRVVFAVIGPQWVKDISRLSNPTDMVRHELTTALAQAKRIVPLFVGFQSGAPDFSTLPDALKELPMTNAVIVDASKWALQSSELVERLKAEWLAVEHATTSAAATFPPSLPYLCDRNDQEQELVSLIERQTAAAPVVCVVHGHKEEAHREFLDRLVNQGWLEDILRAKSVGIHTPSITPNRERWRDGRHRESIVSALKYALLKRPTATDDDLRAYFTKLPKPLVAVLQLTWSDFGVYGADLVEKLTAAWRTLLQREGEGEAPVLPQYAVLWINVTYDDVTARLGDDALAMALPKLGPVEDVHIRSWLDHEDVRPHIGHKQGDLEALGSAADYCYEPGKLHMRKFAEGVKKVLSRA